MFAVPASSLLFASRRDPFAVSSTTLGDRCHPEFPLPASGPPFGQKSGEQKRAKPRESYTYIKVAGGATAANVFFAANVIPWNELRGRQQSRGGVP
jgi:hypothetical protein